MSDAALRDLARAAGLQTEWEDAAGDQKSVSSDSLRAILDAMGLASSDAAETAESRRRLAEQAEQACSRFTTAVVGQWVAAPSGAPRMLEVEAENGERRRVAVRTEGDTHVFEAPDTPGYYTLAWDSGRFTLAVAPQRAWTVEDVAPDRRLWGAAAQIYSLRGRRSEPFGDFGALADFSRALARRGGDALAISPVHALFAADPSRFGPYAPSTRLFLNVLFADPTVLDPMSPSGEAGGELIDWPRDGAAKLSRLRALYAGFPEHGRPPDREDLAGFRREGGEDLEGHARFEALHAHFRAESGAGGWQAWPPAFHDPKGAAVEAFARENSDEVTFHIFLQWLADRSLRDAQAAARAGGMSIGLIADLAVGMDAGGSHAWSRPDDLLSGLSIGAPPDIFQPTGQDWGLAAFSPQALRRTGFKAFIATLRAAMKHSGGVRIDHAMGLQRLWLTPHGASPRDGAYLSYPRDDMLRLIALESWRHKAIVVGEDLGTVPVGFREATTAMGMFGMRVLWFERETDENFIPPERWSREAMAMTSTHDLPTVAGWWRERDIDWLERLNRRSRHADPAAERAHREKDRERLWRAFEKADVAGCGQPPPSGDQTAVDAAVAYVARAGCDLAIVPVEDLLGHDEQPNHPGTTTEAPNWRRRLEADPDTELGAPRVAARIARLNAERPRPARPSPERPA